MNRSEPQSDPIGKNLRRFAIAALSSGVLSAFTLNMVPYILRRAQLNLESVGWYAFATIVPSVLQFIYTPMVDRWLQRKVWLYLLSVLTALVLAGSLFIPAA